MRAFGDGSDLWRVDVVLRNGDAGAGAQAEIVELLRSWLEAKPSSGQDDVLPDVASTYSYDMEPPGGSVGVSAWVRADSAGDAVQMGLDTVQQACVEVIGAPRELWDLRAIPRAAIMPSAARGTPLGRQPGVKAVGRLSDHGC